MSLELNEGLKFQFVFTMVSSLVTFGIQWSVRSDENIILCWYKFASISTNQNHKPNSSRKSIEEYY